MKVCGCLGYCCERHDIRLLVRFEMRSITAPWMNRGNLRMKRGKLMKTHRHASEVLPCPNLALMVAQSPLVGGCSAIIVNSKSRSCSAVQPDMTMVDVVKLREAVVVFVSGRIHKQLWGLLESIALVVEVVDDEL